MRFRIIFFIKLKFWIILTYVNIYATNRMTNTKFLRNNSPQKLPGFVDVWFPVFKYMT